MNKNVLLSLCKFREECLCFSGLRRKETMLYSCIKILYSFAFAMNQYNGDDTPAVCMIGKIRVFEEALS